MKTVKERRMKADVVMPLSSTILHLISFKVIGRFLLQE